MFFQALLFFEIGGRGCFRLPYGHCREIDVIIIQLLSERVKNPFRDILRRRVFLGKRENIIQKTVVKRHDNFFGEFFELVEIDRDIDLIQPLRKDKNLDLPVVPVELLA